MALINVSPFGDELSPGGTQQILAIKSLPSVREHLIPQPGQILPPLFIILAKKSDEFVSMSLSLSLSLNEHATGSNANPKPLSKKARATIFFLVLIAINLPLSSQSIGAPNCTDTIRSSFQKITAPMLRVTRGVNNYLARGRRARALRIEKILGEKWEASQRSNPANADEAWSEYVHQWELEILDRTENGNRADYPELEELLALMAAKSPTFKTGVLDFLNNYGDFKYKAFAQFLESDGSGPGTTGQRFWSLWQARIKLPMRRVWSLDDFSLFITETSNAMFRTMHPEPSMRSSYLKALSEIRLSKPESFGRPRPEVVRDFYRYGLKNTLYRRLTAYSVVLFSRSRGTALIEENSGLTIEDVDLLSHNLLYDRLPRGIRNALVLSRHPEVYNELLLNAELEQLSLETLFFLKPLIMGLLFAFDPVEKILGQGQGQLNSQDIFPVTTASQRSEALQRAHREINRYSHANRDMMQSLEDHINTALLKKTTLERELSTPTTTAQRARVVRRLLEQATTALQHARETRDEILQGVTEPHTHH